MNKNYMDSGQNRTTKGKNQSFPPAKIIVY